MLARLHSDLAAARARRAKSPAVADRHRRRPGPLAPVEQRPDLFPVRRLHAGAVGRPPGACRARRGARERLPPLRLPADRHLRALGRRLPRPMGRGQPLLRRPDHRAVLARQQRARSPPSAATSRSPAPGGSSARATSTGSPSRSRPGRSDTWSTAISSTRTTTPAPSAPGSALFTHRERQTVWRNLTLRGEPTIPRVVRLSQGDRLEGWISGFYNETQPTRLTTESVDQNGQHDAGAEAIPAIRRIVILVRAADRRSRRLRLVLDRRRHPRPPLALEHPAGACDRSGKTPSPARAGSITIARCATETPSPTSSSTSPTRSWSIRRSTGWPSCSSPTACGSTG